jgi:ribosomal protein S18 acetylase RimI-like enzyme
MDSVRQPGAAVRYSGLDRDDLVRIADIDRSERIDVLVVQNGTRLEERHGDWSAPAWLAEGEGEHSLAAQRRFCEEVLAAGGTALGAFSGERLVGIGVVRPSLRPGIAQLAYLHVSNGARGRGIGVHLTGELERIARESGDTSIVVSATPSANTVRFYLGRGYEPMEEPLPELLELEPEDVHMSKQL